MGQSYLHLNPLPPSPIPNFWTKGSHKDGVDDDKFQIQLVNLIAFLARICMFKYLSIKIIPALNNGTYVSMVFHGRSIGKGACCALKSLANMLPMVQDTGAVVVIMGVSGSGKSTIGNLLAEALNCPFLDADDFHPDSNKEKMSKGIPLSDEDRMPWLQVLCQALREYITSGETAVLACSALRNKYRGILRSSDPSYAEGGLCKSVKFVLLDVPVEVLCDRLNRRLANGEHFMPPTLLNSQLELLEIDPSEGVLRVDATQSPSFILGIIQDALSQAKMV